MRKSCRCRNIFQNEHVFGQKNRSRTLTFPPIISNPANTSSSKMESAASPLGVSALSSRPRDAGTRAARGERWWAWAGKTIAKGRALARAQSRITEKMCRGSFTAISKAISFTRPLRSAGRSRSLPRRAALPGSPARFRASALHNRRSAATCSGTLPWSSQAADHFATMSTLI